MLLHSRRQNVKKNREKTRRLPPVAYLPAQSPDASMAYGLYTSREINPVNGFSILRSATCRVILKLPLEATANS